MSGAELLTTLLKTISDTVLIIDSADRINYCGGGSDWVQLKALRGKTLQALFGDDVAGLLSSLCEQNRNGDKTQQTEIQLTPEESPTLAELGLAKPHWYRVSCSQLADKAIVSLHDITRQKEVEERARLQSKQSEQNQQNQRDPLTGVYSRNVLVPMLNQGVALALRYECCCSLVLIDIDDFSGINERYGRDGGDLVLQALASELEKMKRAADFLVRLSNDRLAMMLPETRRDQSGGMGRRVIEHVSRLEVQSKAGPIRFKVSIGTASVRHPDDTAEAMSKRASENLGIAKLSGGNRVEVDEPE